MNGEEKPKLHLPPWFQAEGWEGVIKMKQWFAVGFVELTDGQIVKPTFISIARIESEVKNGGKPYWRADEDLIVLETVSVDHIRSLLPTLEKAGAFNTMRRYASMQWEE